MPPARRRARVLAVLAAACVASAQLNECTDLCATCQFNFCWGETQICVEPNMNVGGDWYCKCVVGSGQNTVMTAACVYDECSHPDTDRQAVCSAEGQSCRDPVTAAHTFAGGAVASIAAGPGLRHGEGNCNTDADCVEGHLCFFHKGGKLEVPGVDVSSVPGNTNICYFPFVMPYTYVGDDPTTLMQIGEGDCDNDSQCAPGLKCWMRGAVGTRQGTPAIQEHDNLNADFCYKEAVVVVSPTAPLGIGEGNCESDADCAAGLHCFYRQASTAKFPVPGIDIQKIPADANICYRRADTSSRGGSLNDWTCSCIAPATGNTVTAMPATCTAPPTPAPPTLAPSTPAPPTMIPPTPLPPTPAPPTSVPQTPFPPTPAPPTPLPPTPVPPTPIPPTPAPPTSEPRTFPFPPLYLGTPEFDATPTWKATPEFKHWVQSPEYKVSPGYTDTPEFEAGRWGSQVYRGSPTYKDTPVYKRSPMYTDTPEFEAGRPNSGVYRSSPTYKNTPEYKTSPDYLGSPEYKDSPEYKVSPGYTDTPEFEAGRWLSARYRDSPTYKGAPNYKQSPMYTDTPEFEAGRPNSGVYRSSPTYKNTPEYKDSPDYLGSPEYKVSPGYTDTPEFEAGRPNSGVYRGSPTYKDTPGYRYPPLYQDSPEYKDNFPIYKDSPGEKEARRDFPPLYMTSPEYKSSPMFKASPAYKAMSPEDRGGDPTRGLEFPPLYISSPEFKASPGYKASPLYDRDASPVYKDTPAWKAQTASPVERASPAYKARAEGPAYYHPPLYIDSPEYKHSPEYQESPARVVAPPVYYESPAYKNSPAHFTSPQYSDTPEFEAGNDQSLAYKESPTWKNTPAYKDSPAYDAAQRVPAGATPVARVDAGTADPVVGDMCFQLMGTECVAQASQTRRCDITEGHQRAMMHAVRADFGLNEAAEVVVDDGLCRDSGYCPRGCAVKVSIKDTPDGETTPAQIRSRMDRCQDDAARCVAMVAQGLVSGGTAAAGAASDDDDDFPWGWLIFALMAALLCSIGIALFLLTKKKEDKDGEQQKYNNFIEDPSDLVPMEEVVDPAPPAYTESPQPPQPLSTPPGLPLVPLASEYGGYAETGVSSRRSRACTIVDSEVIASGIAPYVPPAASDVGSRHGSIAPETPLDGSIIPPSQRRYSTAFTRPRSRPPSIYGSHVPSPLVSHISPPPPAALDPQLSMSGTPSPLPPMAEPPATGSPRPVDTRVLF